MATVPPDPNQPPRAPIDSTSPLYDQILSDFLKRAETDDKIPTQVVKNLKAAFNDGPPKSTDLVKAFSADDDVE